MPPSVLLCPVGVKVMLGLARTVNCPPRLPRLEDVVQLSREQQTYSLLWR